MSQYDQFNVVKDIEHGTFYEREREVLLPHNCGEFFTVHGNISKAKKIRFMSDAGFNAWIYLQAEDDRKLPIVSMEWNTFVNLCREVIKQVDDPGWPNGPEDCVAW